MNGDHASAEELKTALLADPLFAQFNDRPDCLEVHLLAPGHMRLELVRFPELDISGLNASAFSKLELPEFDLSGGFITSGGPDRVFVQYDFSARPEPVAGLRAS